MPKLVSQLWDGIDVRLLREPRRSVSMQIAYTGVVVVKAPMRLPEADICNAMQRHEKNILKRVHTMRDITNRMRPVWTHQAVMFQGALLPLMHEACNGQKASVELQQSRLIARNVIDTHLDTATLQWYRAQAARIMPPLLEQWAQKLGVRAPVLTVRTQQKRWGSCSSSGNISLNAILMAAPHDVMQCVVVHEIVHLLHANHQPAFYQALTRAVPGYRIHQQWLSGEGAWLLQYYSEKKETPGIKP